MVYILLLASLLLRWLSRLLSRLFSFTSFLPKAGSPARAGAGVVGVGIRSPSTPGESVVGELGFLMIPGVAGGLDLDLPTEPRRTPEDCLLAGALLAAREPLPRPLLVQPEIPGVLPTPERILPVETLLMPPSYARSIAEVSLSFCGRYLVSVGGNKKGRMGVKGMLLSRRGSKGSGLPSRTAVVLLLRSLACTLRRSRSSAPWRAMFSSW